MSDCDQATAPYAGDGGMVGGLLVEPGSITPQECGTGSQAAEFANSLAAGQDFRVQPGGGRLALNLPAGGPVLLFEADTGSDR